MDLQGYVWEGDDVQVNVLQHSPTPVHLKIGKLDLGMTADTADAIVGKLNSAIHEADLMIQRKGGV